MVIEAFQKWIAFSGSASATPAMLNYAKSAVQRAMENGWFVMVGDSPKGVDMIIVRTLLEASYSSYIVSTIPGESPRALVVLRGGRPRSKGNWQDYHRRDCAMIELADTVMCIWNGTSKGTKAAFDHAVSVGAEAYLVDFSRQDRKTKRALVTHIEEKQPEQETLF